MNMLFISHSSLNNLEAQAVCDWLREQGWDEIFLGQAREVHLPGSTGPGFVYDPQRSPYRCMRPVDKKEAACSS